MSRAAKTVNRECGLAASIGELLYLAGEWYRISSHLLNVPAFIEGRDCALYLTCGQEHDSVFLQYLRERVVFVGAGELGKLRHCSPELHSVALCLSGSHKVL